MPGVWARRNIREEIRQWGEKGVREEGSAEDAAEASPRGGPFPKRTRKGEKRETRRKGRGTT